MDASLSHNIGLKPSDIAKIQLVFENYSEVEKVIVYGSRAIGNNKPYSDIDITLVGLDLDLTIQNRIENELDDLLLPYKFDISVFHQIQNCELTGHIERVGKVIYP